MKLLKKKKFYHFFNLTICKRNDIKKIFDSHKKHVKIKIFSVAMPSEDTKILEFNKYQKPHPKDIIYYLCRS